jgi:adenine-specific DNA-methyltransferase
MTPLIPLTGQTSLERLRDHVEVCRKSLATRIDRSRRSDMGQFFTPWDVARQMAAMFDFRPGRLKVLDPGAGAGVLAAAFVAEVVERGREVVAIDLTCCEIDPIYLNELRTTLDLVGECCRSCGIELNFEIVADDFVEKGSLWSGNSLFEARRSFDFVIMNPPYRKLHSASRARATLKRASIDATNLYSGFFALALGLLEPQGEIVAITPRSFCNGAYFLPFRKQLLESSHLREIHVFEARDRTFSGDRVLQENIILKAARSDQAGDVLVSSGLAPGSRANTRSLALSDLVHPGDPQLFIRLPIDGRAELANKRVQGLPCSLEQLGLAVSTGRVVAFRAKDFLRTALGNETVPLFLPQHLQLGRVSRRAQGNGKKPEAILASPATMSLLLPRGNYVVTKRISAKEEKRRVVPAVLAEGDLEAPYFALENHLNYYHRSGCGLGLELAQGLAIYLGSSLVDRYLRQFNGQTQVNATDLRSLRYPTKVMLEALGKGGEHLGGDQQAIDDLVEKVLFSEAV